MDNGYKALGTLVIYVVLLFLVPLFVQLCWNYVVVDWGLPHLTYWKAFVLTILVSLLSWPSRVSNK